MQKMADVTFEKTLNRALQSDNLLTIPFGLAIETFEAIVIFIVCVFFLRKLRSGIC